MKKLIATIVITLIAVSAAHAADTADIKDTQTTSLPPQNTTTYPCWDMMQDGHMQHMHGMMDGNVQMPPGVKAHTCWDATQDGHMMRMHNMQMMWNGTQNQPDQKK